jgi:hypothetical protein
MTDRFKEEFINYRQRAKRANRQNPVAVSIMPNKEFTKALT